MHLAGTLRTHDAGPLFTDRLMIWWGSAGFVCLDRETADVICSRHWPPEIVQSVFVMEDGTLLVVVCHWDGFGTLHVDPVTDTDTERFFDPDEYRTPNGRLLRNGLFLVWKSDKLLAWRPMGSAEPLVMEGHQRAVRGAVELSDNRLLSYAGEPRILVWSLLEGQVVATLDGHTGPVRGVRALAGGDRLLSWSDDQSVICWDVGSGEVLSRTSGPGCDVTAFHALDVGLLLSTSLSGVLRLWEPDGRPRAILEGHAEEVEGWRGLGDDRLVTWRGGWSSDAEALVRVWSTRSNAAGSSEATGHTGTVMGLLALDETRLLSWGADRSLRLWDRRDGGSLGLFADHPGDIDGVKVLDRSTLLTWTETKPARLYLWDLDTETADRAPRTTLKGHAGNIRSVEVLDDGKILSRGPKRFVVWDPVTGRESHRFPLTGAVVCAREYLEGRRLVEVSTKDGHHIAVWDPVADQVISTLTVAETVEFVVSEDGDVVVYALYEHRLAKWTPGQAVPQWTLDTGLLREETDSLETIGGFIRSGAWEECKIWDLDGKLRVHRPAREHGDPDSETHVGLVAPGLLIAHRQRAAVLLAVDLEDGREIGRLAFGGMIRWNWTGPTYVDLADSRILFGFYGGAMTWNPYTGDHARLQTVGHLEHGTIQLNDGRCVSLTESGDLVAWCPQTGAVHHRGSPRCLLRTAPDVVRAWYIVKAPHQFRDGITAVADREGVVVRKADGSVVEWHASGDWTIHAIEADGRVRLTGGTLVLVLVLVA